MVLICSSAELRQRVGAVVPSGVEGFVGTVGLDLAEEEEVAQLTGCAKTFEAPVDEGFVRGRRERRVREVDGVKGIGAVRANLVAGCGGWQLETDPGDDLAYGGEFPCVVATSGSSLDHVARGG